MKKFILIVAVLLSATYIFAPADDVKEVKEEVQSGPQKTATYRVISGAIKSGETFFSVFKKYGLNIAELFSIREASADVHRLGDLKPGQPYKIVLDETDSISSLSYWIDDDSILNVERSDNSFSAEKNIVQYEKRTMHMGGTIKDNLVTSLGDGRENLMLAMELYDIFAWDIDFTSDLRKDDTYKIVLEGLYLDGEFKKYGNILSAEFSNNGKISNAYRFEYNGKAGYHDADGNSLKKAFLKAPLNFRRISSYYSRNRLHPILKVYRPHHGLDYSAPVGTPVSALGDGKVVFAGRKSGFGKLVILRHHSGFETYYGHLSKIAKNIRTGKTVEQGQIIGNVGNSGLSTGPHLHFEIRVNNKPVNPLHVKLPRGESVPARFIADFKIFRNQMNSQLASINPQRFALAQKMRDNERKNDL